MNKTWLRGSPTDGRWEFAEVPGRCHTCESRNGRWNSSHSKNVLQRQRSLTLISENFLIVFFLKKLFTLWGTRSSGR